LAQLIQVIILLATGGANGGGYLASKYVVLAIYGFILLLHGLINSLPIHWLSWFGQLGAFWNVAGIFFPQANLFGYVHTHTIGTLAASTHNLFCFHLLGMFAL
jgi:hypothetical protein